MYFSKEFINFFKELEKTNTSEWFNDNRKRYEKEVKKPFHELVQELINQISKHEPEVEIKPGDAIFRINRDIRFSADKRPYNTHVSANISKYGRKSKAYPGFYIQFQANGGMTGGGAYMPEKEELQNIRGAIMQHPAEFKSTVSDKNFVKHYGGIQGEKNKIIPAPFKDAVNEHPMIANKQFYFMTDLGPDIITREDIIEHLMEYYLAGKKVNEWLREAMSMKLTVK